MFFVIFLLLSQSCDHCVSCPCQSLQAGLKCGFDSTIEKTREPRKHVNTAAAVAAGVQSDSAAAGLEDQRAAADVALQASESVAVGDAGDGLGKDVKAVVQARIIKANCVQKLQVQLLTEFLTQFPRRGGCSGMVAFAAPGSTRHALLHRDVHTAVRNVSAVFADCIIHVPGLDSASVQVLTSVLFFAADGIIS